MTTADDAETAIGVVAGLWRALAEDDDAAVRRLVLPTVVNRVAQMDPRVADRFRSALDVTPQQAAVMGASMTVRVLRDGSCLVKSLLTDGLPTMHVLGAHGPEQVREWPLLVVDVDGEWRVWGTMFEDVSLPQTVDYITVVPPAEGQA